ncbi:MAG: hypothetical protein OXG85_08725 [Chloroflexi bacterium]|nr:hypothetical protein [Chloroflexota bacterium]
MTTVSKTSGKSWLLFAASNLALLVIAVGEGILAFFSSLEIVLTLGAQVIWQSMGDTVQGKYALATLRNIWLLIGGLILLSLVIYCIHYYFGHWRERRIHGVYILMLAVFAHIILAAQFMAAL